MIHGRPPVSVFLIGPVFILLFIPVTVLVAWLLGDLAFILSVIFMVLIAVGINMFQHFQVVFSESSVVVPFLLGPEVLRIYGAESLAYKDIEKIELKNETIEIVTVKTGFSLKQEHFTKEDFQKMKNYFKEFCPGLINETGSEKEI